MRCGAFFSAEIAKVEISWFAPSVDDRSTLAMPVDTVEAECAVRTLKGREVVRWESYRFYVRTFIPSHIFTSDFVSFYI